MTLTFIDIVFLIIIFAFALVTMIHGFIKEIFGKLAVIAGIVAGFYFCALLAPYLQKLIPIPVVDVVLSFILIFIAVFLFVKILQIIVSSIFSGEIMKSLDRVLGFAFGALEGLMIVSCAIILIRAQPYFQLDSILEGSFIASILNPLLEYPVNYIRGILA